MSSYHKRGLPPQHAAKGQAITELALISGIIALMLLGIIEAAGAYGEKMDIQAAVSHAVRIGALLGNAGGNVFTCPSTSSGVITDTVDMGIIQAISTTQGIDMSKVSKIEVYNADISGSPIISGGVPLDNVYTPPFITSTGAITKLVTSQYNWPSCTRSSEPADSLGVHVSYNYHPITPLFGQATIPINDQFVERINPTKNDNPCPVPEAPTNLAAHWSGTEPSTTDAMTWTASANATSYKIYPTVNGSPIGTPYTYTPPSPGGTVNWTYNYSPPFPAASQVSYVVKGNNYCGDGDGTDPAPDGQYALPITPTIVTATQSLTSTGNDYLAWTAVPDAQSYTITQTSSTGVTPPALTIPAVDGSGQPITSTLIADSYSNPPVTGVTYRVAATSLSNVAGPAATTSITLAATTPVTIDDSITSTTGISGTWTYTGTGWTNCNSSSSCAAAGVSATGMYSNTLSFDKGLGDSASFYFQVPASQTVTVTLYGAQQNSGGSAQARIDSQSWQSISYYANPASTAPVPLASFTVTGGTTASMHSLTVQNGSSTKYISIDAASLQ